METFLLNIGASALGALVAAWLAFHFALRRLRHERAFDRQLAWLEKGVETLVEASAKIRFAVNAQRDPALVDDRSAAWAEIAEMTDRLYPLPYQAELYTSPGSYKAIDEAIQDFARQRDSVKELMLRADISAPNPSAELLDALLVFERAAKLLLHAASRLAGDMRSKLGLEPVERPPRLYDEIVLDKSRNSELSVEERLSILRALKRGTT